MKDLIEKQNDLKEKAESILNTAKEENRAVTNEEKQEFDNVMNEIDDIQNTIEMKERIDKMENKEIKVENISTEEKDIKAMADIIRGYVNTDPTHLTKGDNGAVIQATIARKIIDKVIELSPLYASATKYHSKGTLYIPKVDTSTDDITVAYATEFSDLTSRSNKFDTISLTGFLIGALTKVSKSLLNNSDFDLVNFVIDRMAKKFAIFYEKEMLYGTNDKIAGIKGTYDSTNMKKTLGANNTVTADELIDIQDLVPDEFQANAYWIMNRATRNVVRKLKDGQNNYLLNQVFGKDWDYELLGKPVKCSENCNKLGQNAKEVIFYGDFSALAVKETEEVEIAVLNELYATQHAVGVCGYAELDAKVENTQAIAVAVTPSGSV